MVCSFLSCTGQGYKSVDAILSFPEDSVSITDKELSAYTTELTTLRMRKWYRNSIKRSFEAALCYYREKTVFYNAPKQSTEL